MIIIGIQGIKGSFSEEAALKFASKHNIHDYKLEYLVSTENVLEALEHQKCEFGIFAIENSTGGVVMESIHALAKHRCHINEMFSILVQQNLLAKPNVTVGMITEVHSHRQALRQCKEYLKKNFPKAKLVDSPDTALCAEQLKTGALPETTAVVANKACAKLYDLQLLDTNINDLKDNQTLFIAATPLEATS